MVTFDPARDAQDIRSHKKVLQDAGQANVCRYLQARGFDIARASVVTTWAYNDSIPGPYWKPLSEAGFATLDELAEYAASKKRRAVMDTAG